MRTEAMWKVLRAPGVLLAILWLSLGLNSLQPTAAAGGPLVGAIAPSEALAHSAQERTELASGRNCVPAGLCWSLPPKNVAFRVRAGTGGRSLPTPWSDMATQWRLPPPDQPPRSFS